MKILVVGAGAIGGYFGGRLLERGKDVTFLVRENRRNQLEKTGLIIDSINGDFTIRPPMILSGESEDKFDLILITTKSYQLYGAIDDIRPHLKKGGMVLPLLNGVSHVDELVEAFGEDAVIGGLCFIETTLDANGTVVQPSPMNQLVYGERTGEKTPRIEWLESTFRGTKTNFVLSENINQEMWHKYAFITAMSGVTSLMASPIGPITELESGKRIILALLNEISNVMRKIEAPIQNDIAEIQFNRICELKSTMKSSMQRDMEKSLPTEAEHLQGFLIKKASEHRLSVPILDTIYTKLSLYEEQRSTN